jgi:Neuraminidase (sialidase)
MEINNDNEVVLIYREAGSHTAPDSTFHIRFSDDYGATWSARDTYLDASAVTGFPFGDPADYVGLEHVNEPWLYKAPNGNLILHMWRVDAPAEADNCTYQSVSTDGGKTWSAAAAISITGQDKSMCFYTDDHFVYDGVIYAAGRDFTDVDHYHMLFIKSTDNGATWTVVSNMESAATDESTVEVGIEYLGNNRIIAIYRTTAFNATVRSYSDDMGLTWSRIEAITYNIPRSGRHRIWTKTHLEGGANWWNDSNLVMIGFQNYPGEGRKTAVWYSKDGGQTWTNPRYLEESIYSDAGYADMIYNPSTGKYVLLSYIGPVGAADAVIKQYNVTPDWNANEV